MRRGVWLAVLLLGACGSKSGLATDAPDDGSAHEHDLRFIGLWIVEQNSHALYEATLYDLQADGTLLEGPSVPADCTEGLSAHCVTGSVARCTPANGDCADAPSCVFGDEWHSLGSASLVIAGECSDGLPRDIRLALDPSAEGNTTFDGAGGTVVSVGGESGWVHDNWDWSFRKCVEDDLESCCSVFDPDGMGELCRGAR